MKKYAILRDIDEEQGILTKRFLIRYEEIVYLRGEMFSSEIINIANVLTNEELKHTSIYIDDEVDYLFEAEDDEAAKLIYEVVE